jgi:hypothetical protein
MKAVAVLIFCGALGARAPSTVTRPAPSLPPTEAALCATLDTFAAQDRAAGANTMKLAHLRWDRRKALLRAVPGGRFTSWLGTVADLHTGFEGKAALRIELPCRGALATWGGFFSDLFDRTQISRDSELYPAVTHMKRGSAVTVSGRFVLAREDGFREASLDEQASMRHPEFIVHFKSIAARLHE